MKKAREAIEQDRWEEYRDDCLTRFVRSDKQI
jgi:queuine tRNA-ribosyltransferase